jgi:DNA-directed RNA polymerase subunit RPC12/RpoP
MMSVRCGRCRTEFPVQGPGRFPCPACGAVNEVRAAPPVEPPLTAPAPTPVPASPSPRVTCGECSFTFIVGDIDVARCPNCGAEVIVGDAP